MNLYFSPMRVMPDIRINIFPGVYEPSDDSYMLIEAIDVKGDEKVLDMGCGSGIVALHLAKSGCDVVAVDVNDRAVENTMFNAKSNELKIKCMKSDLFENIDGKFDIITFNPPYLPTEGEDKAWDGGERGRKVIDRFLRDAWRYLTEDGKIYMVMSSFTDVDGVMECYKKIYSFKILKQKHIFFETIYVFEITRKER
ncbi:MAG: methyltransferase [Thermoplasmata archaeon]|nr:MAG: methyltransferase [Thermoplasmata archaeon]